MAIKQRTPIIKPRIQGGTFYTFGSALEDIGLNINETSNKVSLSHYVLLDIPKFTPENEEVEGDYLVTHTKKDYSSFNESEGDYIFAEFFQDAILNMEAVLRNQSDYNYASLHTVSERAFWYWLFRDLDDSLIQDENHPEYYYQYQDSEWKAYAKCFGRIVSGSQRTDSEGIYNESFVQIPSSYGQMRVLFKRVTDENYTEGRAYESSNNGIIEGIQPSELDSSTGSYIESTGIDARGIFTNDTEYEADKISSTLEVEFDLNKLASYYGKSDITYDDIGFGNVDVEEANIKEFNFNAILVYYSVYDPSGTNILSTNAFGLYLLGNSVKVEEECFKLPEFNKVKSTTTQSGTSFSFRINIKPTSAYSGDIVVSDNSSTAFAESTDFNDVIKNLSVATEILKTNARTLSKIVDDNLYLKSFAKDAIEKVEDISKTVNAITTDSSIYDTLATGTMLAKTVNTLPFRAESISDKILKNTSVTFNSDGKMTITIDTSSLNGDALIIANNMMRTINNVQYCDLTKLVFLLISRINTYH